MSAGIQALVVRSDRSLPISPNPPTHPFTHCLGPSGWQHFPEGDRAAALSPWLLGGGRTDSLGPLPGADGAAPTPMGAGSRSGPWVSEKEAAAPRRLTRAG